VRIYVFANYRESLLKKEKEKMKNENVLSEKRVNRDSLAKLYERYAYASLYLGYFDFCVKRSLPTFLILFVLFAFGFLGGFEKLLNILVYVLVILLTIKLIHEILALIEKHYQKMVYDDSRIFYKMHVWEVNSNMTGYYLNQPVPEKLKDLKKLPYSLTFRTIYYNGMQPVKKSFLKFCADYYYRKFIPNFILGKFEKLFEPLEEFYKYTKILEFSGLSDKFKLMMYEVTKDKIEEEEDE